MADSELLKAMARQLLRHNQQVRTFPLSAAGTELTIVVPGGEDWRLLSLRTALTTSAAVPTRAPTLTFDDQTNVYAQIPAGVTQAASLTVVYNFVADMSMGPLPVNGGIHGASIPQMVCPSGTRIRTSTSSLDVADQWLATTVLFEMMNEPEYLSPTTGTALEEQIHDALQMQREGAM